LSGSAPLKIGQPASSAEHRHGHDAFGYADLGMEPNEHENRVAFAP
jgi:hypothetical protein